VSPRLTQAGYNPEWELVYQLDTLLAIRRQDVCSACLRAIDALKKKQKRGAPPIHREADGPDNPSVREG
jgi:hypothetical protein